MKEDNLMLYFRGDPDEANTGTLATQLCVPAANLVSISPASDTTLTLTFKSIRNNHDSHNERIAHDEVTLTITEGDAFEVMEAIMQSINSNPHHDGFLVIADETITSDSAVAALNDKPLTAKFIHPSIASVAITSVGSYLYSARFPDFGVGGGEPTNISATALSVNTHYQSIAAATAMTIPSAAAGKAGDWITVFYDVKAGDGNAHTYTTTTDTTFSLGSTIRTASGSHADRIPRADIAVAGDAVITITGATNGDGGQGTYLKFVNVSGGTNGWACEVYVTAQGTGIVAGTAAFS